MVLVNQTTEIPVYKAEKSRLEGLDLTKVQFGKIIADHMLVAEYEHGQWQNVRIQPMAPLPMSPALSGLHYGQSIFEGMKAFRNIHGGVQLFRPDANLRRMNASAERLCMPPVPEWIFIEGLKKLVHLDQNWVPFGEGTSLYIRPIYFATDEYVGMRPSETYTLVIFSSPASNYYTEPVKVMTTKQYVRSVRGGVGNVKMAGNYAASLKAAQEAKEKGYHSVVWLDAIEQRFVEECGTMNIFFVIDNILVTPPTTNGTILEGVTRDSVIRIAKDMGLPVEERPISMEEIRDKNANGELQEAFGAGTAVSIAPIVLMNYEGSDIILPPLDQRPITNRIYTKLNNIRTSVEPDPYGWIVPV
ncbi:MAG: branched-chain amino acid aminotransferase [Bacteroidia bacterium]|nr:branched-chain amino acid aminotransferase [Bacteroidia bacterium]